MRMILIEIYEDHWLFKKPMHDDKRLRNSRALPYMEQECAGARTMDLIRRARQRLETVSPCSARRDSTALRPQPQFSEGLRPQAVLPRARPA